MFWGVTLESGKKYTQVVDTSFHVSMATLEPSHEEPPGKFVMLMLEHRKAEFQLCALEYNRVLQVPLDLNFVEGEEITFYLNGAQGIVHLSGYLTEIDNLRDVDEEDEDVSEEDASEEETHPKLVDLEAEESDDTSIVPNKEGKTKAKKKARKTKELQLADGDDVEDESSDEDYEVGDGEWQSESEEDEEVEDEEEEDEEDEEVPQLVGKKRKRGDLEADTARQQNSAVKAKAQQAVPQGKAKAQEKRKEYSFSSASTQEMKSPESKDDSMSKRKRKKANKAKVKEEANATASPQTGMKFQGRPLPGGTQYQDLRIGSGPVARPGRTVHVYYVGRLTDNKEFDSCRTGKAFSFKLGKGEVIKGWEKGIEGMKVGGKRKLVIPPGQAYGNNRVGSIPANSTLVFEVELKAVS